MSTHHILIVKPLRYHLVSTNYIYTVYIYTNILIIFKWQQPSNNWYITITIDDNNNYNNSNNNNSNNNNNKHKHIVNRKHSNTNNTNSSNDHVWYRTKPSTIPQTNKNYKSHEYQHTQKTTINNVRTDDSYYVYSLTMIMITMWKVTRPTWVLHLHFEYSKPPGLHQHQAFECHRDQHPGAPSLRKCRDSHSSLAAKKWRYFSEKWSWDLRNSDHFFQQILGCFMLQKAGFQSGAANIPAPRTSWTSLCRQQETQNDQTPWQPGLGILGKSIASSQTQGIFRQFHGIKIGNLEEWLFLSVWYSPQLLSRGCVLLALRLDAEVPTSAPWGIAPSQVVSHWQSLGRRFLGF